MRLTKVKQWMDTIKIGSRILFKSYGACETHTQLGRSSSAAIIATGTVVDVYPRFVRVKLKAVHECVMWDSIWKVDGRDWPLCNERRTR